MSKKQSLIKGTIILTIAGLLTRFIGFYYKIFLSNTIGAKELGIYQLIAPVQGLMFSLCIASIQTSISRYVAVEHSHNQKSGRLYFKTGFCLSFSLSMLCAVILFFASDLIAQYFLLEPRCGILLRYLAFSIPAASIHACFCGYYLGLQNSTVCAWSQFIEQCARVGGVITFVQLACGSNNGTPVKFSALLAVGGSVAGEICSMLFCIVYDRIVYRNIVKESISCNHVTGNKSSDNLSQQKTTYPITGTPLHPITALKTIWQMALPLTCNRVIISLLVTLELSMVPLKLRQFGMATDTALSLYGVMMGMAFPFITFPNAITNSIAVMLLPSISKAQSENTQTTLHNSVYLCTKFCLWAGILCSGIFLCYGMELGNLFFDNKDAGIFIQQFSFLCPFLYLNTTLASILNGLGKTGTLFIHNTIGQLIHLAFIMFCMPYFGVKGFLWGYLCSELSMTLMHYVTVLRELHMDFFISTLLPKPFFYMIGAIIPGNISQMCITKICPQWQVGTFSGLLITVGIFGYFLLREFKDYLKRKSSQ